MTATTPPPLRQRYDSFTLALHWVTAASVIFLFARAHIWEQLERGTLLRKGLLAALFHHYLLRDSVLRRMLPGRAFC